MKLDRIIVTKILRCFRTNGCKKWRNRFKKEKFVVLAEYFEQQADCSREKLAKQGEVLRGGISRIYLSLSNKWKPCHGAINSRPRHISTALQKYFRFQWYCKQLRVEARSNIANCEIYFQKFLWNYTYNFENIFTASSWEV